VRVIVADQYLFGHFQGNAMPATALIYPGIRRRLASGIYDGLLLIGVAALAWLLPHIVIGQLFHVVAPGPVLAAHLVLLLGFYFLWYWHHGGQTLAMQTWKIRLISVTGNAPARGQLITRFVLAWPSIGFFGAGLMWALFDRDRQFLHDRFAGTRIVFKV
jgi:uncharacterized RDD family membrane protein YckC